MLLQTYQCIISNQATCIFEVYVLIYKILDILLLIYRITRKEAWECALTLYFRSLSQVIVLYTRVSSMVLDTTLELLLYFKRETMHLRLLLLLLGGNLNSDVRWWINWNRKVITGCSIIFSNFGVCYSLNLYLAVPYMTAYYSAYIRETHLWHCGHRTSCPPGSIA